MEDKSRVTVRIYGQEYTIAGGNDSERIVVVANHVDTMMNELSKGMPSMPASMLAVLTAVNTANDLFDSQDKVKNLEAEIQGLRKDTENYIRLWEEAKASFKQYKEDAQNSVEQLQELQRIFNLKNVELNKANDELEAVNKQLTEVKWELAQEKAKNANDSRQAEQEAKEAIASADEISKKYKELENNFFDIQMENIQLKNELDILKKKTNI